MSNGATPPLPAAEDSERQVLGALMSGQLSPEVVAEITAMLTPAAFHRSLHRDTYATIIELLAGDERPDVLLVVDAMRRRGLLNGHARDPMQIRDLAAELLIAMNAPAHAHRVAEAAERRRAVQVAREIAEAAASGGDWRQPVATLHDEAERHGPAGDGGRRSVEVVSLASVAPRAIRWLYADRIPLGELTLAAGEPGIGKSLFATEIAARVSRGQLDGDLHGEPGNVLMIAFEDETASVLRPRVEATGGDLQRVTVLRVRDEYDDEDDVRLPEDLPRIIEAVEHLRPILVVIDPIGAAIPGRDGDRYGDVLAALRPVVRLARHLGGAVLAVTHLNKGPSLSVVLRVIGSVAWSGTPRAVLAFGENPKPEVHAGSYAVILGKTNLGARPPALLYDVERVEAGRDDRGDPITAGRMVWRGEADLQVAEMLAGPSTDRHRKRDDVAAWLRDVLAAGPVPVIDLQAEADERGFGWRTVERAKAAVGAEAEREGGAADEGRWVWVLT